MSNLLILDADSIVYTSVFRGSDSTHSQMMGIVSQFVEGILSATYCDHYLGFIGGTGNFRKEVAKSREYKGSRKEELPSITYWKPQIRDFLVDHWGFTRCHGIEADDACSIAYHLYSQEYQVTIGGVDHDLLQIPGQHYNYNRNQFTTLTPFQAAYNFHHQLLTGCTGDDVPGLPRVGPVKATKLLEGLDSEERLSAAVQLAYLEKLPKDSIDMSYYTEQYQLLKLLDCGDKYGFQCPQPIPVPQAQEPVLESIDHLFN